MRRLVVAFLALAAVSPLASAQVPEAPVDEAVLLVCGAAPVDLPVCPQVDPVPPPAQEEAAQEPPAAPPATPQDAKQLAEEAVEDAGAIVDDPTTAPDRVASLVATIVQFVKDALGGIEDARVGARERVLAAVDDAKARVETASDAVGKAVDRAVERVKALLPEGDASLGASARRAPVERAPARDATRLVDGLLRDLSP